MATKRSTRGTAKSRTATPPDRRSGLSTRGWAMVGSAVAVGLVALLVGWGFASSRTGPSVGAGTGSDGVVVQASGGRWTNITAARLASMLTQKDFTLLNVKTPYSGEIAGTDLYIPYTEIKARAAELPALRTARIVVYCRSGHESAIAAQALIDLGYTNIYNLDGGMAAWTANGGQLVQVAR